MIYQGKKRYSVKEVCLHTSATTGKWALGKTVDEMMAEVRHWHVVDRGWRAEGYHRLFAPNGNMALGRSIYEIGAGVRGHNRGVVHLCMVPIKTIEKMGEVEDFYTSAQIRAVKDYIAELNELSGFTLEKVTGHNQYANKLCPGFIVKSEDWLPG